MEFTTFVFHHNIHLAKSFSSFALCGVGFEGEFFFFSSCSWNFRCILHTHNQIEQARDIDEDMDEILEKQQQCFAYPLLHTVAYY